MDPEAPSIQPILLCTLASTSVADRKLILQLPYSLQSKELLSKQFSDLCNKISLIPELAQIHEFKMKWANSLEESQITKIIDFLPKQIKTLRIYGCLNITCEVLSLIFHKFQCLEHLNLFYEPEIISQHVSWDYQYQTLIQNSAKNFRISQKWLSLVNRNTSKLYSQILPILSSKLYNLSLRNICLGKDDQSIKKILKNLSNLQHLDIGQTQVTDKQFQAIQRETFDLAAARLKTLRLDCNRVTQKILQLIYPTNSLLKTFINEQLSPINQPNLSYLDISKTNMVGIYSKICKSFRKLKFLGMSYIEISEKEIEQFCSSGVHSMIQEIIIEFVILKKQSLQSLIQSHPFLRNLSLTNINPEIQPIQNQCFIYKQISQKKPLLFTEGKLQKINLSYNSYVFGKDCLSSLIQKNPGLEIVKISGTKMQLKDLQVLKKGQRLKWLEISHLEQLEVDVVRSQTKIGEQMKQNQQILLFMAQLVQNLPRLEYIQAYGVLDQTKVKKFQQIYQVTDSRQDNTFTAVLDSNGPLVYKKNKK